MSGDFNEERTINAPVVIDGGSWMIKAGFAGDLTPHVIFPSVIGQPKHKSVLIGHPELTGPHVGDEAIQKRGIMRLSYPIQRRQVTNFDEMEKVWHHTFYNELNIAPEDHSLLLTESPFARTDDREKTAEIMFETFNFPSLCVANQAVLSLHASGGTTGVVVETGDKVTDIVPVWDGKAVKDCSRRCDFGGRDITNFLRRLSCERGYAFMTTAEIECVRRAKEELSYIALEFDKELEASKNDTSFEKSYFDTPNSHPLTYGSERFRCSELLFQPYICGMDCEGIHQEVSKSILRCEENIHKDMYSNIVLSGGTSCIPGFRERLLKELQSLLPTNAELKCFAPTDRKFLAWKGGSMIASQPSFQERFVTKEEYDEIGPHEKVI